MRSKTYLKLFWFFWFTVLMGLAAIALWLGYSVLWRAAVGVLLLAFGERLMRKMVGNAGSNRER